MPRTAHTDNILQPAGFGGGALLQPLSANNHTTSSIGGGGGDLLADAKPSSVAVGSTWSSTSGQIAIDLDNLMSGKSKNSGPALSMNQLKIQSPVKSQPSLAQSAIAPPFQANLIGAPTATTTATASKQPQYTNIPMVPAANSSSSSSTTVNHQQAAAAAAAVQQQHLFGNLVSNQFNAFQ